MIPQTLGALIGFLGLVAPGLAFEAMRERRRPQIPGSAFREASRVALASLWLVVAAVLVQVFLWGILPATAIDLAEWVRLGDSYMVANLAKVALNLVFTTALACGMGFGIAKLVSIAKKEKSSLSNGSPWHEALRPPDPGSEHTWAHVQLRDGTAFFGYVESYTLHEKPDERDILLYGTAMQRAVRSEAGNVEHAQNIGSKWEKVVVSGSQIAYIRVQYRDAGGALVRSGNREPEPITEPSETDTCQAVSG